MTKLEVKDPSDLPDVEPGKGVLAKTVSQSPITDTEKQRLQQSISVYSEDYPDSNALVKVCASNIANSRIESLRMIDLVKDYKGKSEQERIEEMYKRSSLQSVKLRKTAQMHVRERNSSAKDLLKTLIEKHALTDDRIPNGIHHNSLHKESTLDNYFVIVLVYDSIKKKKQSELVCSVQNTFSKLFECIECPCKFSDSESTGQFASFLSLNSDVIVKQDRPYPVQTGLHSMIQARRKMNLETRVLPAEMTRLCDVPLIFGQGLIFRDLPRCDHLIFFKDVVKDPKLRSIGLQTFPVQTFYPRLHRHPCEACGYPRLAKYVVHKDKFSLKELAFYCRECYEEMFLDEQGLKKDLDIIVLPYLYD